MQVMQNLYSTFLKQYYQIPVNLIFFVGITIITYIQIINTSYNKYKYMEYIMIGNVWQIERLPKGM